MEKAIIYLPVVAAILWGATYVVTEKAFQTVNVPTLSLIHI